MRSVSTRFLGQPRLTEKTFVMNRPHPLFWARNNLVAPRKEEKHMLAGKARGAAPNPLGPMRSVAFHDAEE
jgi:hypothetical protein